MGGPVGAHQSRPVHRQYHVEPLERYIVEQHVKSPLQKAGIYGKYRDHPLLRQSSRHGYGVTLGDAHIKKPLGPCGGELLQARTLRHGGGNGAQAAVLPGHLYQLVPQDIGEIDAPSHVRPSGWVKRRYAVTPLRLGLGGMVALAFHRTHMKQHRTVHFPGPGQGGTQLLHIMPVHRPKVGEPHILKHGTGVDGPLDAALDAVVQPVEPLTAGNMLQHRTVALFEPVVPWPQPQAAQVCCHAAHVGINRHAVVVENHHHGLSGGPGIIESLVGQPAGKRPIPDEGRHTVVLPPQRSGPGHAQGYGHGVGRVAGHEGVVAALLRLWETGQTSQLPEGTEQLPPSGKELVDVALVSHIEHQTVPGRVVDPVEGYRQLHGSQIGRQMPPGAGHALH